GYRGRVAKSQRTQPDRLDGDVVEEPGEKLGSVFEWDFDILDDGLPGRAPPARLEPVSDVEAAVEGDELPVHTAATQPSRPQSADPRVLRAERAAAPEPVGIPAPEVVVDGEKV